MASSRVGTSLRSARERAGLTREALAHLSGLSWAAIAQIESGRRQEVRVGSLVALANALDVSIDYLVGNGATVSPKLLQHRAVIYGSDDQYLASLIPFLTEGIAQSEAALVVTGRRHIKLLHDALGADAVGVEFRNSDEWYTLPTASLNRFRSFVERRFQSGAKWIRIVGEPVWNGRTEAEIVAWHRYESMLNLSFASSPATVVCPYDSRHVPEQIVADACHTHPEILECGDTRSSPTYRQPEEFLLNRSR